jgi:hypothetical protein
MMPGEYQVSVEGIGECDHGDKLTHRSGSLRAQQIYGPDAFSFAKEMASPFLECSVSAKMPAHRNPYSPRTSSHETEMEHETKAHTIRLTSEITRCIAKSLLASAAELERSLWHHSNPIEHSQSSTECDDDALKL